MADRDIIELRHSLHKNPEISNCEYNTAVRIDAFMKKLNPDDIISLGSTGRAYIYDSGVQGRTVMFRAELDAVHADDTCNKDYCSVNKGVAHSCGHDGHMAIVAAVAKKISAHRPQKGRVILLFQPAEEMEQGAFDIVNDINFTKIEPDYIFAIHNIPGYKKGLVIVKSGNFSAASKGMTIKLFGKTSHIAKPENGVSPANAVSDIIKQLDNVTYNNSRFNDSVMLTITHINMGEVTFNALPGYADIMVTMCAYDNSDMKALTKEAESIVYDITKRDNLSYSISYNEEIPATINSNTCTNMVINAAAESNSTVYTPEKPFKWSEDFAYYTEKFSGCMFGIGAGVNQPDLHNTDYDFPDDIIDNGVNMFFNIYKSLNL